ncbi:uncharacterized protein H6S33_003333 [Morchella sextelata]|uniref:uncharacterized protein n=1 Tax=Morchella sextelata TaxID=1174677 RepID=UPI001D05BDB5|nr:uncharacterized protein H6S33_003333 [Morchella sextelata]KAH0606499.1 hypothetical protein H6S33_003333 [Morchella sextelata]
MDPIYRARLAIQPTQFTIRPKSSSEATKISMEVLITNTRYNYPVTEINRYRREARYDDVRHAHSRLTNAVALDPPYGILMPIGLIRGKEHRLSPRWSSELERLNRLEWKEPGLFYGFDWFEGESVEDCNSAYKRAYGWE